MRASIACIFAVAVSFSACSEDIKGGAPFGPDHPLDVSGVWKYEALVVKDDCSTLFCSECHHDETRFCPPSPEPLDPQAPPKPWYECIQGERIIRQDGENLVIRDHLISVAMGVEMHGTVRPLSGDFLCGRSDVDESGTTLLYTEDGTFLSNDHYESTLALSSSKDGPVCKIIWSVTGRRAD